MAKTTIRRTDDTTDFYIVGIGASAGGLEALEHFFTAMPGDGDMAFVIIQHLSPDYKSHMVELLSKYTPMPVHGAKDGIAVQPNNIYLLPHRKNMTIFKGKLYLVDHERTRSLNLPIDIFFESLAKDQGEHAIGIILSGTGSDGSRGLRTIKELGGMVMAQDESAKFDGMPRSATSTQLVDYVLPPQQMPASLLSYVHHPCLASDPSIKPAIAKEEDQMGKLFAILRDTTGLDFTGYKPNTITRRIERRMSINQIERLQNYTDYLAQSPTECKALYKEFLISVTRFFRDPEAFKILQMQVIPLLCQNRSRQTQIRVWVPGCATGEEAYSLAILFREYMESSGQFLDVKIFATDLDKEALEYANQGVYPEGIMGDVSASRLQNFFIKRGDSYEILRHIRTMVVFARQNILKDPPFSKMDLITCRNLLIYLKPELQRKVLATFQFALNPNGYLFLGSSESVGKYSNVLKSVDKKWKIYQYEGGAAPSLEYSRPHGLWRQNSPSVQGYHQSQPMDDWRSSDPVLRSVIEQVLPPSVVIDENQMVTHIFGDVSPYLKLPQGYLVSLNLLKMARSELSLPLSTALYRTIREQQEVTYRNIVLKDGTNTSQINLTTRPFMERNSQNQLYIVYFTPILPSDTGEQGVENYNLNKSANQRIVHLEQELQFTSENLQASIEELETANEELQAMNEELLAANEELQSTNEELQSVNEEMITVNNEYQLKIDELTALNDDINNLFNNTEVGTVFLDSNLCLRRFTPTAQKVIHVLEKDIDRPLSHITHKLIGVDLGHICREVLETLTPFRQEVRSRDHAWYQFRVVPFRTQLGQIEGVVLLLVDITALKEAKLLADNLIAVKDYLDAVGTLIVALNRHKEITFINQAGAELLDYTPENLLGKSWVEKCVDVSAQAEVYKTLTDLFAGRKATASYPEHPLVTRTGQERIFQWEFTTLYEDEKISGILGSGTDITSQKQAETALADNEFRYRAMAHHLPNGALFLFDHNLKFLLADGTEVHRLGMEPADFEGKHLHDIYQGEVGDWLEGNYLRVLSGHEFARSFYGENGQHYLLHFAPLKDNNGQIFAGMVLSQNLTSALQTFRASNSEGQDCVEESGHKLPITLFQTDSNLRYQQIYNPFEGIDVKEILGKTDFEIGLDQDEAAQFMEIKQAVLDSGNGIREEISLTINNQTVIYKMSVEPLLDDKGSVIGVTVTAINLGDKE